MGPWGHPESQWNSSSMTPLILPPLPHEPPTMVSRARSQQGVCPPAGDEGRGGGNGRSLAWSPPSTSLSPMGASPGVWGWGTPPCFGMGIVAPTGAHKPPRTPKGEPGKG